MVKLNNLFALQESYIRPSLNLSTPHRSELVEGRASLLLLLRLTRGRRASLDSNCTDDVRAFIIYEARKEVGISNLTSQM